MAENVVASNRTKHVDIRFRFVNNMVKEGLIEIIFVKSKENVADVFTKNTPEELNKSHHPKLIVDQNLGEQEGCWKYGVNPNYLHDTCEYIVPGYTNEGWSTKLYILGNGKE